MAIGTGAAILGAAAIGAGTTAVVSAQQRRAQREAQERAQEEARQAEARATEEARRTEERIEAATALTPEEQARRERTFALEERRLPLLEERAGRPGEELIRGAGPRLDPSTQLGVPDTGQRSCPHRSRWPARRSRTRARSWAPTAESCAAKQQLSRETDERAS